MQCLAKDGTFSYKLKWIGLNSDNLLMKRVRDEIKQRTVNSDKYDNILTQRNVNSDENDDILTQKNNWFY